MKTVTGKKIPIDGKTWLKNSVSVWSDIEKTAEERSIKHPAMFPSRLVERIIECYARIDTRVVIDPFLGSGSTLVGAYRKGLSGVGFEVVPRFSRLAFARLNNISSELCFSQQNTKIVLIEKPTQIEFPENERVFFIVKGDVRTTIDYLKEETCDIAITSPPYWIVHKRKRTVDNKDSRPYSNQPDDLGNIEDYNQFLRELEKIFMKVFRVLKNNSYAIVNVMDLRYGALFIPFHIDITNVMISAGFILEDIIIWNRAKEYNNLRPIGYPYKFIVNKVHEYLLIFKRNEGKELR